MAHKSKYLVLIILVILFLIMRLPILITSIDRIYFDEEFFRGNIAKELIVGPILPFFDYQRSEYEGGSLVAGVLAVPFFLLFGETVLSLKLVVLLFSVATLILWYLFLDKFFHRKIAILATLLGICSPPFYTKMGLFTSGSYFETNFFTILAISIFYQLFYIKQRTWLFAILGLVSGFALFFSYVFSVTLLAILLFWFILDKKFLLNKNFVIFSIFFLCGFSPWIYYNLTHHFEGFIVADKPMLYWFTKNSLLDSLLRFKNLMAAEIANSFGFENLGFISHRFLANLYYLIFVCFFTGLIFAYRRPLLKVAVGVMPHSKPLVTPNETSGPILLIVFLILHCIIFSFSAFEFRAHFYTGYLHRYRYLLPIYPFIFALTAIFYYRVITAHRSRFISYFSLSSMLILLLLGFSSNLNLVTMGTIGRNYRHTIYKGYNYYDLGKIICWRFNDSGRNVELIKRIKRDDDRRLCYAGMGWGFGKERFDADYRFYIRNVLPKFDKQYWPDACERVGLIIGYNNDVVRELKDNLDAGYQSYFYRGVGVREAKMLAYNPKQYMQLKDKVEAGYVPYFHEGMGMELYEILMDDTESFIRFNDYLDAQSRVSIYKGIAEGKEYYQFSYDKFGFGVRKIGYNIKAWNKIIDNIEDAYKPYCYQRLGIEIGWRFIHDIKKYLAFLARIDEKYSPSLCKGMGIGIGWRFGYAIDDCVQLIKKVDQKYRPHLYEGLGIGVVKRYGCHLDERTKEAEKIPPDYRPYFQAGAREASDNRVPD